MQYPIVVAVNVSEYALCVFECKNPVVGATPQLTHLNIFGTYQAAVRELARLGATTHSVVYRDVPVQLLRDHQKTVQWRAFKSTAKKTGLENGDRVAAYLNGGALLTANLALATMRQFENATHVLPESITTAHGFSRTFGDAIQHPDTEGSAYLNFSDDRVEFNVWTWRGDHIHLECQFYPSQDALGVAAAVRTLLSDKAGRWAPRMTLSQLYVGGYCSWTNINDWQWYEGVSDRTTLQAVDSTRCFDVDLSSLQTGQDLRFALEKYAGKYGRDGVPLTAAWAAMSIIDNHGADLKGMLQVERVVSGQGVSGKIARTLDRYGLGKLNQFGQRLTQTASKGVFLTSLALALAGFALAAGWELNTLHNGDMQLANRQAQAETERDKLKIVSRQAQIVNTSLEWFNQRAIELDEYRKGQEVPSEIVREVYGATPFYNQFPLVQHVEIKFGSDKVEIVGYTDVSKAAAAGDASGGSAPPHLPPDLFDPVRLFQEKLEKKTDVFARLQSNYDRNKPDGARFSISALYVKPWRTDALKPLPIPQVLVDAAGQNPTLLSQKVAQK